MVSGDVRQELAALIASKIRPGMSPQEAAEAVIALTFGIEETWEAMDVTTLADLPDRAYIDERWIIVRIPREGVRRERKADRRVE